MFLLSALLFAVSGYGLSAGLGLAQGVPPAQTETAPVAPTPGGETYVGEKTCQRCHASEATAWKQSDHARAMAHATDATVLGDFNDAHFTYGDVTSVFFRRDGKFFVRTDGPDGKLQDFEIKFTFGVDPLQQYLIELPGGRLQALSIAWDSRPKADGGQRWFHLYPNEKIDHRDPLHWTGLQQNWNFMCAECHSTNLQRNYDAATRSYATSYSEINVACETCHGPGSRHVAWAERRPGWRSIDPQGKGLLVLLDERHGVTWAIDPQTGSAARSTPRKTTREIETCALCHARRGPIWATIKPGAPIGDSHRISLLDDRLYYPDGQIRDEVYEYGSLLQSKMFAAGVTCSDCHDPHSLKLRAEGNAVCEQCHAPEKFATTAHHHHKEGSAGAQCVACHMPARTYMVVDPRRDHSFRIPRPDLSATLGTPNACNGCHADKPSQWAAEQIKGWYGTPKPGFQRFGEALHAGSLGAPGARARLLALAEDTTHPAIARASALSRVDRITNPQALETLRKLSRDPDPLVRRAAVAAYAVAPLAARRDLWAMLDDPIRDVRLEAARQLADLPGQRLTPDEQTRRTRGIEEYIASQRSNADRPEAHHNLGLLFITLGRAAEAESELKAAVALDPSFVPAAVTLADLYRALGRDGDAEPVLRDMIARYPEAAAPHHALALWLVRAGRRAEAMEELKRAVELAPDDPRMAYVYAVALAQADRAQAISALKRSLARHPYHRDTLSALAAFSRDAGDTVDALRYAETLAKLEPDDPSIQAFVRQLRQ
ncbi:MAG: multiheme c-type cytochrome [Xanthobacteraceae bacterium]